MFVERLNKNHIVNFVMSIGGRGSLFSIQEKQEGVVLYTNDFMDNICYFLLNDFSILPLNAGAINCTVEFNDINRTWRNCLAKVFGREYIEQYKKKCFIETIKMNEDVIK